MSGSTERAVTLSRSSAPANMSERVGSRPFIPTLAYATSPSRSATLAPTFGFTNDQWTDARRHTGAGGGVVAELDQARLHVAEQRRASRA